MNDLLTAAKAVIEMWDNSPPVEHCQRRAALRAAVERAENQEAVGFDWWLSAHTKELMTWDVASFARLVWTAAQQAERERVLDIFRDNRDVFSEGGFCLVTEKIDEVQR